MHLIQNRRNYDPVSILHTSDIHLAEPSVEPEKKDMKRSKNPFHVLKSIVKTANVLQVDLVLISGDLFDIYHPTQKTIHKVLDILNQLIPPLMIIPGNHDALGDAVIYQLPIWDDRNLSPHIIKKPDGELLEVPGIPVVIWGRAMVEHTADFKPLGGIPERNGGAWHVAMAHGFFYTQNESGDRSSPIYAQEISNSNWDYIALGHKHIYAEVSQGNVRAAYSGAPVGLWSEENKSLLVNFDGRRNDPISITRIDLLSD